MLSQMMEGYNLNKQLRVLLTNDDGIDAEGLRVLATELAKVCVVLVAAPDRERSATGHAITMHQPLRARPLIMPGADRAYAVSGTPADCVKLAVDSLYPGEFDLVVSGINRGANLGTDVLYSGTVSAALEGVILGLPAVAFSLAEFVQPDFRSSAKIAASLVSDISRKGWLADTLLNINFPNLSQPKGLKVTTLGRQRYVNAVQQRQDPWGGTYYWLCGERSSCENLEPTDVWAVEQGFVSLTPVHFDLTDYRLLKTIEQWKLDLPTGGEEQ